MQELSKLEQEIEKLPLDSKWQVAQWLLQDLHRASQAAPQQNGKPAAELDPDYAGRRRKIFGSDVLPNMVLESRSEER